MGEVKDLDALVPEPKRAKLGGVEYNLPGDLPMEIFLRINKAGEHESESEAEALEMVISAMSDLFAWETPDSEKDTVRNRVSTVLKGRGVEFCLKLTQAIYAREEELAQRQQDEAAAATEADPQ